MLNLPRCRMRKPNNLRCNHALRVTLFHFGAGYLIDGDHHHFWDNLAAPLTFGLQSGCMFLPHNFNLIELESCRRQHVVLASLAMTVSLIEMHLNLAEYYQQSINAFERTLPDCRKVQEAQPTRPWVAA